MNKQKSTGFTIVELLIVIVVIAILASISIVAYNGIQARAENSKTIAAAGAYFKAIKMYEVDKGEVPHNRVSSCLGESYVWDFAGNESGDNQCRSASISYYRIRGTINTDLKKYITPLPEPSMKVVGDTSHWLRGITYLVGSVGKPMVINFGLKDVTDCPAVAGQPASSKTNYSGGIACSYIIGTRLH